MEAKVQKLQTVCVFCGSSLGKDPEYMKVANSLGHMLATRKIRLLYGGGNLGLMGCVANSAYLRNGKVLGITPKILGENNIGGSTFGDEFKVPSMHGKMAAMLYNVDAFIALPGGLGTLEEIFCITSWAQLNLHRKPVGLLNINGFYSGLTSFIDHCVEQEFIEPVTNRIIFSAPTLEQLIDQLEIYVCEPNLSLLQIEQETKDDVGESSSKKRELDTMLRM